MAGAVPSLCDTLRTTVSLRTHARRASAGLLASAGHMRGSTGPVLKVLTLPASKPNQGGKQRCEGFRDGKTRCRAVTGAGVSTGSVGTWAAGRRCRPGAGAGSR